MTPLRYGLIGCGMMGQEHLRNVALLPDAEVAAILDPDAGMRAAAAELAPAARFVRDLDAMLSADLDALIIASPNHLHAGQIAAIARARPLPLMVEKPVCVSLDQARVLEAATAGYPAPIWVAMEYRYMPALSRLIAETPHRTGGVRMLSIREHRHPFLDKVGAWNRFNRNTGGTLVEKCCHFFDLMRLIVGDRPVRIFASAGRDVNHLDERYDGETPDIVDNAFVVVDFAGGARAMLDLCMFAEGTRWQEEVTVTGPAARIDALTPGPARFSPPGAAAPHRVVISSRAGGAPEIVDLEVDARILAAGSHNGATWHEHVRFRDAVRGLGPVEVSLDDGLKAVRMGLAAHGSAATGEAVRLDAGPFDLG